MKASAVVPIVVGLQAITGVTDVATTNARDGKNSEAPSPLKASLAGVAITPDKITTTAAVLSSSNSRIQQPMQWGSEKWRNQDQKRYEALVTKEALGTLTQKELHELDNLQRFRREVVNPPTGEEILSRYSQQKLDQGMLALLGNHVRITPLTSSAKTNSPEILYSSPAVS